MKSKGNEENSKKKKGSGLRLFGKILLGIFIFIILVILFIRSPWGQNLIVDRFINSISEKTDTTIELDRLYLSFSGNLNLDGLYLEDQKGDTLVYSHKLEANIPLWPIIKGDGISIENLEWEGVVANIDRKDTLRGYNYEFLMEALSPADTSSSVTSAQDTTAAEMKFSLGYVNLADFRIQYSDQVTGVDSRIALGQLALEMKRFSLDSMNFEVGKARLIDTRFSFDQNKTPPEPEEKDTLPMPSISIESLRIDNVAGGYNSLPDKLAADIQIDDLILELPRADLQNRNIIIERLGMRNSDIIVHTQSSEKQMDTVPPGDESSLFEWPQWKVVAQEISLSQNYFEYILDNATPREEKFDPNAIILRDLNLQSNFLKIKPKSVEMYLQKLNFQEASGLAVKALNFDLNADDDNLRLVNLNLLLNKNRISEGEVIMSYPSVNTMLEDPETITVNLDLPQVRIDLNEIFRFQPDLREDPYMEVLSRKPLDGRVSAEGTTSQLQVNDLKVNWGTNTLVSVSGQLFNILDPQTIRFDLPQVAASSSDEDLNQLLLGQDLGIRLPQKVSLVGDLEGSPEDLHTEAQITTTMGNIDLKGRLQTAPSLRFATDIEVDQLQLGKLLENDQFGSVTMHLNASGSGTSINTLDASLISEVNSFSFRNYEYTNFELEAEVEEGEGYMETAYKDENLNLNLDGFVELDSLSPRVTWQLEVIGADLQALDISKRAINAAFNLQGDFEGNASAYDLTAGISNGIAVYNNDTYLLGDLDVLAHVRKDTTSLDVQNQMLDLELRSNTDPTNFTQALNRHYESYFSETSRTDTIQDPVNLELSARVSPAPIMQEVLLPQLQELDTLHLEVDFREKEKELFANVDLPHVKYYGSVLDSLSLNLESDNDQMRFSFALDKMDFGPLAIQKTVIEGVMENETLDLVFTSFYEEKQLINVNSEISSSNDVLRIHLNPDDLVLNYDPWQINPDNEILIGDTSWTFTDFILERNNQRLEVSSQKAGIQGEHIAVDFENFRLATLFSYLNPERVLASGQLNGDFIIEEPFGSTGMLANLNIQEFAVMEVPLGILTMEAEAAGRSQYSLDMGIKEGGVDLDLTGSYIATEEAANLDLQLDLNSLDMEVIQGFVPEVLSNGSGDISGSVSVNGTTVEPRYEGEINFNQTSFTVLPLNAPFTLPNESLRVDNSGLFLSNLEILDRNNNSLVLDGSITTETLTNPGFNLSFSADNFTALNSTEDDHELFYGTAVFDVDGSLTGDLEVPQVEMDLNIREETNMTYVIPQASLAVEEREGVVVFVNRENPDQILTQTEDVEEQFAFTGIQLNSYISLEENATFKVVLDEETGNVIQASGEGDLVFDMYPNGRTTLSGRLEINDGFYEMSLYDLVTRRFELMDGSSIVWAGDPFDADLNISAVYRLEASASALMAPQITGADMDVRNRFRQELPFLVYLNIDGELARPQLSFGLDMPEDEQGAVGGQVYGRVQQINQQETELNKQVFSLLVLNRFFPDAGSDGSQGGTLAFARDNLNEALSDQLNIFSDRLLGETGIDLQFGLDTYTDYQGARPEERTQLDITAQRSFMDERMIVSVGSEVDLQGSSQVEEESPVIGNVSLEYLLTENGRFRLKAFRRKSYENVIDGQLIISGLSLIFTQDFNKFRELWDQIVQDEKENNEE